MIHGFPKLAALVAVIAVTAGCGEVATSPGVGTAPSASVVGGAPVLQADVLGGYVSVLPGAVAVADGTIHAWVVAFGRASGDKRVFHVTSADGLSWEALDSGLAGQLGVAFVAPGPIPTSVLAGGGEWAMYLWGTPASSGSGPAIWRATAPGPAGPWTVDQDPVLTPGSAGGWDAAGLAYPSVVRTDAGYLMAFVGARDASVSAIGVATSTDGVAWSKRDAPIASPGLCGGFDGSALGQSRLIAAPDGGYRLAYAGTDGQGIGVTVGLARSDDGVSWTCASPTPLLDAGAIPGSGGLQGVAVAADGSEAPRMLVESLTNGGSELWLARLQLGR